MTTLHLTSLSLHHFRNYEHARIEVSPQPVVLHGHNGAGKTNILEAISLMVPGRGLRRAKLGDFTSMHHAGNWAVVAHGEGLQGEVMIGTGRDAESTDLEKRAVRIDGRPARSQAELTEHMAVLWLTPQMEQLFNEGTSDARKFLDRLVYSFDADHATRINAYEQAMRERNRLLSTGYGDAAWLDALENTMAEQASAIADARITTIQHLNHTIAESTLSFPKPVLDVGGAVEDALKENASALEAENRFRELLANNRMADTGAGRTLIGTHRSELVVRHREKGLLAAQCSTGEQKALILSIVLAQSRAGSQYKGVVPIMLLDEVVAHLDPTRRLELFEEICQIGAQVWMSGTDASLFDGMQGRAQFFELRQGTVI